MPKRQHKPDERWERTEAGLLVPRRPTLPTRRHIQHLGTAQCCCEGDSCGLFTGSAPASVSLEVAGGVVDGDCDCAAANDTFEIDFLQLIVCKYYYELVIGDMVINVAINTYGASYARIDWALSYPSTCSDPSCGVSFGGSRYDFTRPLSSGDYSVPINPFATSYCLGNPTCDVSSTYGVITIP